MISLVTVLIGCCVMSLPAQQEQYPFENEIMAYRAVDRKAMPAPGGTLFIGSSSIRLWEDLEQRFAKEPIIKRGVGGCQLAHFVDHYLDSIVFPYQARKIFVYAGENDIASGQHSAEQVAENFRKLYGALLEHNPKVKIYYLSIKPSSSRLQWQDSFAKANQLIERFLGDEEKGEFIDVGTVLIGTDGMPDDTLFREDRLHLNKQGYDCWEKVLRPYVEF